MRRFNFSQLSFLLLGACLFLPVVGCGDDAGMSTPEAVGDVMDKAKDAAGDAVDGAKEATDGVVDDAVDSVKEAMGTGSDEKEGSDDK